MIEISRELTFSLVSGAIVVLGLAQALTASEHENNGQIARAQFLASNNLSIRDERTLAPGEQLISVTDPNCGARHLLILGSPFSMSPRSAGILERTKDNTKFYFRNTAVDAKSLMTLSVRWVSGKLSDRLQITNPPVWPSALVAAIGDQNCPELIW
jgi:chitinase